VYLEDGRLRATLQGDSVRIDELSLRGGDGKLDASGVLPLLASRKEAKLDWKAQKLRVLGRPDMRLVVSGGGSVALEDKRLALQGSLRVDEGLFERGLAGLPKLSGDIVIVGAAPEAQPARRAQIPADIDLLVDLGDRFQVREAGFDGRLKGEVHVSGVAGGELRAFGRIEAAGATYLAYGQKLVVDPGVVIFNGPLGNPGLQITAWRRNQAVEAGVRITGNLQQPRVELVSEPPAPEGTALSWLVLGRAPSDAGGADLAVLQTAATALLGRGNSVPITTRIAQAFGLDELSLRNSSVGSGTGTTDASSRVVALGKRLSNRIYLTYEQGIGTVVQNLVKIDFSLTQRISLRAQTGTTSGLGAFYRYSWD
jgi:translocation and assembly module TamB